MSDTLPFLNVTGNLSAESLSVVGNVSVGNITSASGLIANQTFRSFSKTLSPVQNAFSHICDITGSNAYGFDLTVSQSVSGISISKYYAGTMSIGPTTAGWRRRSHTSR